MHYHEIGDVFPKHAYLIFCDFCAFCGSTALISFIQVNTLPGFVDEIQDQTDDNADDDARGQGEVKGEMFFFDKDVSWQPS